MCIKPSIESLCAQHDAECGEPGCWADAVGRRRHLHAHVGRLNVVNPAPPPRSSARIGAYCNGVGETGTDAGSRHGPGARKEAPDADERTRREERAKSEAQGARPMPRTGARDARAASPAGSGAGAYTRPLFGST